MSDTSEHSPADTATEQPADTATPTDATAQLREELERWKSLAKKHEDRAAGNAKAVKELETLKRERMSETERAIAEARADERSKVAADFGARLVDAEVRAAAAGRAVDVDVLLEGLDRNRFLADGEPNRDAIGAWLDRLAPRAEASEQPSGYGAPLDLGQGARGQSATVSDPLLDTVKAHLGIR